MAFCENPKELISLVGFCKLSATQVSVYIEQIEIYSQINFKSTFRKS